MGESRWPKGSGCRVGQRDQPLQSSNSWGRDWSNTNTNTGTGCRTVGAFGPGGIEGRSLVEEEVPLRWTTSG